MPFYPDDAPVPTGLRSDEFVLRPLRASDVQLDYEAVMASQALLRQGSGGLWPRPDFTFEENLADLQGHEADFAARRGFTYTVMEPAETRCLGCVYVYPPTDEDGTRAREGEAMVWFWVRPDNVAADLDRRLLAALMPWLEDDFAFAHILYRARGGNARQSAIFGEAGLRHAETRESRGVADHLFA